MEKVHLFDIERKDIIEASMSISEMELIYATADFKGLSTGGNVSLAMQMLSDAVCYQSICREGSILYILGQFSVHTITLMDPLTQLDIFIERNEISSALLYATDLFASKVLNRSSRNDIQNSISALIPDLIKQLLVLTIDGLNFGKIVQLIDHYKKHIGLLVRTCVLTSQFDLLYNTIYPCLEKDPLSKSVFFEFLDELIIDGHFEDISPSMISDYLHYLMTEGHLNQFEAAVVRIPIDKLDIHYAMTICKANYLYDGIISIYNRALSDFIGPLEDMLIALESFIGLDGVLSDCETAQGNKLLLYLQCCLLGQAYPFGNLPYDLAKTLPLKVYRCLTSFRGKDGSNASSIYPYIRLLIKFDAPQFFNVICTCSDSVIFRENEDRLQKLILICHQIIVTVCPNVEYSTYLLNFIAHLLKIKSIMAPLDIISELIRSILSNSICEAHTSETERSIIEMLSMVDGLDETVILNLAEKASFMQVCAYFYMKRRQFHNLIQCYIADERNSPSVFIVIENLLSELSQDEHSEFLRFIRSSIVVLTKIDSYRTAELILNYFIDLLNDEQITGNDEYSLLYNCFLVRCERGHRTLTDDDKIDEKLFCTMVEGLLMRSEKEDKDKMLLDLLRHWLPIGSRSDKCLNLAVTYDLTSSIILLLEARMLIDRAFEFVFGELEKAWNENEHLCSKFIKELIRLSSSYHLQSQKGQWLSKLLLKILTLPESRLTENGGFMMYINDIIASIIEGGSEETELIIDTLFNHPTFRHSTYGKYSSSIKCIIEICHYEMVLLQSIIKCIEQESNESIKKIAVESTCRCTELILSNKCIFCSQPLSKSSIAYRCGHIMHMDCQPDTNDRRCLCDHFNRRTDIFDRRMQLNSNSCSKINSVLNIFDDRSMKLKLGPSRDS